MDLQRPIKQEIPDEMEPQAMPLEMRLRAMSAEAKDMLIMEMETKMIEFCENIELLVEKHDGWKADKQSWGVDEARMMERINELERSVTKVNGSNVDLEKQKDTLQNQLLSSRHESMQHKNAAESLANKLVSLKPENLQFQISKLTRERDESMESARQNYDYITHWEPRWRQTFDENTSLQHRIINLNSQLAKSEKISIEHRNRLAKAKQEFDNKVNFLDTEAKKKNERISELDRKLEESAKTNATAQSQIRQLTAEKEELANKSSLKINELTNANKRLNTQLLNLETVHLVAKTKLKGLEEKDSDNQKIMEEQSKKLKDLETQNSEMLESLQKCQAQVQEANQANEILRGEIEAKQEANMAQYQEIIGLKNKLDETKNSEDLLQIKIAKLESEKQQNQKDSSFSTDRLESDIKTLQTDLEQKNELVEKQKQEIESLTDLLQRAATETQSAMDEVKKQLAESNDKYLQFLLKSKEETDQKIREIVGEECRKIGKSNKRMKIEDIDLGDVSD